MRNSGQNYIIWLDTLFTSARLLATLRDMGIGAAGTIRTGQTTREKNAVKALEKQAILQAEEDPSQAIATTQDIS
jgi:hypothetical protein